MLIGKVALITGAGQGIGRAVAMALARQGAKIAVCDINHVTGSKVTQEIRESGGTACYLPLDVSNEAAVGQSVTECWRSLQGLDILVNNAGIIYTKPIVDTSSSDWDRVLAINLKGVFLCTKAVLPFMMSQRSGKIINIASVAGKRGGGLLGSSSYAASKAGVIAFTKSAARESAPYGITVNAITPALTATDMTSGIAPEAERLILNMIPLGRPAKPEDVAAAVSFLASPEADYITGEIMDVDGGLMMD